VTKCSKCNGGFKEGDAVMFTGTSIYHELPLPQGDRLQYALERPHLFTNVEHMICEDFT
jgi:hypothetical protein